MEKINNIYCIEGINADSNSYLIGNILVDTGIGLKPNNLLNKLNEINVKPTDIDLIINTHNHFDHVGGNYLFPNAKIAIGVNDSEAILNNNDNLTLSKLFFNKLKRTDVDIKLYENDKIHDIFLKISMDNKNNDSKQNNSKFLKNKENNKENNKEKIDDFYVLETPGHTSGGICLYDGETLISGDTVFTNGGFGRVDLGGNYSDMENSLKKLNELNVEYILPGHGSWANNGKQHIKMALNSFLTNL
ncbi:MAG: MBL fold metallo-hydrolase [Methanobrevibacter sp.]|jgi:glyoxylase-like metal-dependent hydrolase (beta-lactamase superfamily II)|nr:MBL fold metallo-hydrolase [Candidatus Methanoflexus mossambicus]